MGKNSAPSAPTVQKQQGLFGTPSMSIPTNAPIVPPAPRKPAEDPTTIYNRNPIKPVARKPFGPGIFGM